MRSDSYTQPAAVVSRQADVSLVNQFNPFCGFVSAKILMGDNALSSARRSFRIRHAAEQGAENELLGFITSTPQPSEKALGKRPQAPVVHNAATPPGHNHGSRKATRILPSRTSRKSQGTLMVDELLLDYEQRSGTLFLPPGSLGTTVVAKGIPCELNQPLQRLHYHPLLHFS